MENKERNINIDIVRCVAFLLVVSVHFFLWNGFYQMKMDNSEAFIMCIIRTISMSCVPLFLMISGYLLSKKDFFPIDRKYLCKLVELLIIYLLCTAILIFFRKIILHEVMNFTDIIKNIVSFSQYSWYVAMYAGLYVLMPYLNLCWNNIDGREKKWLVIILCFLSSATSLINIKHTILPEIWTGIYPVMYYYLGACISEEQGNIKIRGKAIFVLWMICAVLIGFINYIISGNDIFAMGAWNDWGALENIILSILLFMFIIKLDMTGIKLEIRKFIEGTATLVYVAFMISYISDIIAWKIFRDIIPVSKKIFIYVPAVMLSFILSLVLSLVFNNIFKTIKKRLIKQGN